MDDRRLLIAIALAGLILFGWQFLLSRTAPERRVPPANREAPIATSNPAPPPPPPPTHYPTPALRPATLTSAPAESLTVVDNPQWKAVFSSHGARPVHWVLKKFRRGDGRPLDLVPDEQDGLVTLALRRGGTNYDFTHAAFHVVEDSVGGGWHIVAYRAVDSAGTDFTVRYALPDTGYKAAVTYAVSQPRPDDQVVVQWRSWKFATETNQSEDLRQAHVVSLMGEEVVQDNLGAFKKTPERLHSGNLVWTAVRSKYFAVAFLFPQQSMSEVRTLGYPDSMQLGVRFEFPLQGHSSAGYEMYAGPVDFWKTQSAGYNLARLADTGWKIMVPLNRVLLKFFTLTHKVVPNYGLVIIVFSVVLRLLFWPLSRAQMRSMQKMQELQPEIERLRQKYKNDQEKLNKEMFALYKQYNVNPFGGCLPILVQMPVFFALYSVLSSSIELRQAGFVGWITDLSAPDVLTYISGFPLHVLPLIMAVTMIWQQKVTPMDPRQAASGYFMSLFMLFIFYRMPSGLVLYWTVTNILTAVQQMHTKRSVKPMPAVAR